MIQIYVEGVRSCSVINVEVKDMSGIEKGSIIQLDSRDWGGGLETYKVLEIEEEKIKVTPYTKSLIISAFPTCKKEIYK